MATADRSKAAEERAKVLGGRDERITRRDAVAKQEAK